MRDKVQLMKRLWVVCSGDRCGFSKNSGQIRPEIGHVHFRDTDGSALFVYVAYMQRRTQIDSNIQRLTDAILESQS